MKKIFLFLVIVAAGLFYSSCSNDIDLTAEWKDIPIVFGLISKSDSVNYIRVEKAFLDNNTSAFDIAQIPDSLYYDNITVQIKSLDDNNPATYDLFRVDGNAEGFPRESGVFANAPNYLYKLVLPAGEELVGGQQYQLQVNRGDELPLVLATETIVTDVEIRDPDTNPDDASPINWARSGLKVGWRAQPDAHIFDVKIYLHIEEEDLSDPANNQTVTLEWILEESRAAEVSNNLVRMDTRLAPVDLYSFLENRLVANPNVARKFQSIDVLVTAGGEQISTYINAGNANTGITSTQVIPTYTNLSEGFGIFSSSNTQFHQGYTINGETVDSLRSNPKTSDFNFQF